MGSEVKKIKFLQPLEGLKKVFQRDRLSKSAWGKNGRSVRAVFYLPDEEFPASATCFFSANAVSFMPLDGLADVAEYTSKGIL